MLEVKKKKENESGKIFPPHIKTVMTWWFTGEVDTAPVNMLAESPSTGVMVKTMKGKLHRLDLSLSSQKNLI